MFYKAFVVILVAVLFVFWNKGSTFKPESVKGRNVVVTGASSGIGEELAYHYAKLGANVFITARRENLLKKVIEKCKSFNPKGKFGYYPADMANYKTESKAFIQAAVKLLGGIDSLVINHAYFGHLTVWHGDEAELAMFEKMSGINFNSYVHIASHALPYLKKAAQGRLGIVSSTAGKAPYVLAAPYCGSKFAMDGFFSSVREEQRQAKTNVTVSNIVMGSVATDNVLALFRDEFGRIDASMDDVLASAMSPVATAEEASYQVLEATETGLPELYYPTWTNTIYLSFPSSWAPLVRHTFPDWMNHVIYTEDFYKRQESVKVPTVS